MTAFATLIGAMAAALAEAPAVCTRIHRGRARPASAEWPEMVVIRPIDATLQPLGVLGAPFNVDTRVAVECYARSAPGNSPDVAVDTLLGAVYARLMTDPTLDGLIGDLRPEALAYDFDADAEASACAILTFTAVHRVQANTLE